MATAISSLIVLAASVTPALGFCGSRTHLHARAEGGVEVGTFGYTGEIGPFNWASLDAANAVCATGTRQSPINMAPGAFNIIPMADVQIEIPDAPEGVEFENLGTTVEAVMEGLGGKMVTGGTEFELKQFHFHHPSEHLDDGVSFSMEMHMVWESAASEIAVVGVFVDLEKPETAAAPVTNATLELPAANATAGLTRRGPSVRRSRPQQSLWKKREIQQMQQAVVGESNAVKSQMLETLFQSVGEIAQPGTKVESQPLVFSELVETLKLGNFEGYSGSLTTPPCSEGVRWMVATQKLAISTTAFEAVRDVVKFNSRFTQNSLGEQNILALGSKSLASVSTESATEPAASAPAAAEPVASAPATAVPAAGHVAAPAPAAGHVVAAPAAGHLIAGPAAAGPAVGAKHGPAAM